MKIYSRVVLDMTSTELPVLEEESFEYHGPVALCEDAAGGGLGHGGDGNQGHGGGEGGAPGAGGSAGGPGTGGGRDPFGGVGPASPDTMGLGLGPNSAMGMGVSFGGRATGPFSFAFETKDPINITDPATDKVVSRENVFGHQVGTVYGLSEAASNQATLSRRALGMQTISSNPLAFSSFAPQIDAANMASRTRDLSTVEIGEQIAQSVLSYTGLSDREFGRLQAKTSKDYRADPVGTLSALGMAEASVATDRAMTNLDLYGTLTGDRMTPARAAAINETAPATAWGNVKAWGGFLAPAAAKVAGALSGSMVADAVADAVMGLKSVQTAQMGQMSNAFTQARAAQFSGASMPRGSASTRAAAATSSLNNGGGMDLPALGQEDLARNISDRVLGMLQARSTQATAATPMTAPGASRFAYPFIA